tara:strand:+ start:188 stop:586 length:399 start_codon:yes stop_codon:yes gene_type:complete
MKKEIILMLLLLLSCVNVEEAPPENLIGEEKMADLIFELAVLDAAKGFVPKDQKERIELDADSFYMFHEIDSAQFTSSNAYYAKHPKAYLRIVSMAKTKLEKFNKNIEDNENEMLKTNSIDIKPKQRKNLTK